MQDAERDDRQHQMPREIGELETGRDAARVAHARYREPAEVAGEDNDEHLAQPERRGRRSDECGNGDRAIRRPVGAACRDRPQPDAGDRGPDERQTHEQERRRHPIRDDVEDRAPLHVGEAKVAVERAADVDRELLGEWAVQTELRPHRAVIGLVPTVPAEDVDRIARRQMDERERQHDDREQQRHRQQEPADDEPRHALGDVGDRHWSDQAASARSPLQ